MVYDNSNTLVYIYINIGNLNYYKIESITETKVEVSFELMQNLRNIIEVANGRIQWKTEELLPVGMIIKQLDDILKKD